MADAVGFMTSGKEPRVSRRNQPLVTSPALQRIEVVCDVQQPSETQLQHGMVVADVVYWYHEADSYHGMSYRVRNFARADDEVPGYITTYQLSHWLRENQHINKGTSILRLPAGCFHNIFCDGSPESLLAFLHDSRDFLSNIRAVSICYRFVPRTWEDDHFPAKWDQERMPATSPEAWRRLCNVLVHECTGLEEVTLTVEQEFWDRVPWRDGAEMVFNTANLGERSKEWKQQLARPKFKNFLQHIARLCGQRVAFFLNIKHPSTYVSTERNAAVKPMRGKLFDDCDYFAMELEDYMRAKMLGRSFIASSHRCECPPGILLQKSCFWNTVVDECVTVGRPPQWEEVDEF